MACALLVCTAMMAWAVVPQAAGACPHNCHLAGACINDTCACDAGWTGPTCTQLHLGPANTARALYRENASSWGGEAPEPRHNGVPLCSAL